MKNIPTMVERALELSKADECLVFASALSNVNIRWASNTSTTNGMSESTSLTVVSVIDGRIGLINRSSVAEDELEDVVRASEAACAGKPQADDYMPLLDGPGRAHGWSEPAEPTSISVFAGLAPELADLFARANAERINLYGYAEHIAITRWVATSAGVRERHRQLRGTLDFTGKSTDLTRSTWAGHFTKTFRDVDLDAMYGRVAQRLGWAERTIDLPAGRYEVLLEQSAVADLTVYHQTACTRREADEGRSVFSKPGGGNRIGESLYPETITIYSDPNEPGLETTPFAASPVSASSASPFDTGLPIPRVDWVRDGVLTNLAMTRNWAKRVGAGGPVPGPGSVAVAGDGPTIDEMIASTERALLVVCLWYIRTVDPQTLLLTGLTRDGVFLVENGEVAGAVNNFRWNMSPVQAFANAREVGRSSICQPREFETAMAKAPPMRIGDFNMSSVSEAT